MTPCVEVHGTARLHLGFLDLNGSLGRRYGSIGLSLDAPPRAFRCAGWVQPPCRARTATGRPVTWQRCCSTSGYPRATICGSTRRFPRMPGLAPARSWRWPSAPPCGGCTGCHSTPMQDARLLERGGRSGIGVGLFQRRRMRGGWRAWRGDNRRRRCWLGCRCRSTWRILLVLDRSREGLSGAVERAAFANLPPMAESPRHGSAGWC